MGTATVTGHDDGSPVLLSVVASSSSKVRLPTKCRETLSSSYACILAP
jgi:hypothetical protein